MCYGAQFTAQPHLDSLYRPVEASLDIISLIGTVGTLAYTWNKIEPVSAWLLAPYLVWLSFAAYLCVRRSSSSPQHVVLITLALGWCWPP
jgi:tryptophan-rich sensory protein